MRKVRFTVWLRGVLIAAVSVLILPGSFRQVIAQKGPITLPMGTVVVVKLDEQVSGKSHPVGASVRASIARDVIIDSVLVIKIGTPVDVTVAQASKAGHVGQAGEVGINIEQTQTVDNQVVFLRGVFAAEGQGSTGASVGAGVVLCPLFLLMKGKEGILNAGTEYQSKTQNAVIVQVPQK
jgi:hypothetical protein